MRSCCIWLLHSVRKKYECFLPKCLRLLASSCKSKGILKFGLCNCFITAVSSAVCFSWTNPSHFVRILTHLTFWEKRYMYVHINSGTPCLYEHNSFQAKKTVHTEGQRIMTQNSKACTQRCCLFFIERHTKQFTNKNPNKMQQQINFFYYSIFIWSSTFFGRHSAHHQEPKTALAASGFSYMEGCLHVTSGTLCLTTSTNYTSKQPSTYEKPEAASAVLGSW
jgi:hypothetical protein